MKKFLYYFRDNPNRELATDVDYATFRFLRRFETEPQALLVNPDEEEQFKNLGLKVEADNKIAKGFFGVE